MILNPENPENGCPPVGNPGGMVWVTNLKIETLVTVVKTIRRIRDFNRCLLVPLPSIPLPTWSEWSRTG